MCVRGWSVCGWYVVVDDSLVENGQSTPYGPGDLGEVGRDGAEEGVPEDDRKAEAERANHEEAEDGEGGVALAC